MHEEKHEELEKEKEEVDEMWPKSDIMLNILKTSAPDELLWISPLLSNDPWQDPPSRVDEPVAHLLLRELRFVCQDCFDPFVCDYFFRAKLQRSSRSCCAEILHISNPPSMIQKQVHVTTHSVPLPEIFISFG